MALRDDLIGLVDDVRREIVDEEVGLRLYTVEAVTRVWSGGAVGVGTPTNTVVTLDPVPKVRAPTGRTQDDGRQVRPDLEVTKISATYEEDDLDGGTPAVDTRFYWRIDGEYYWVQGRPEKRYLEWRVQLRSVRPLDATAVSATLITPTGRTLNPASGVLTETTVSASVTGYLTPTTLQESGAEEDLIQRRGVTLHILLDDLPTRPTVDSRFQVDGRTYRVLRASLDAWGLYWQLYGEESS